MANSNIDEPRCPQCGEPLIPRGKYYTTYDPAKLWKINVLEISPTEDLKIEYTNRCLQVEYSCQRCKRTVMHYSVSPEVAARRDVRYAEGVLAAFGPES